MLYALSGKQLCSSSFKSCSIDKITAESIVSTWMGEKLVEYHALKKIERV